MPEPGSGRVTQFTLADPRFFFGILDLFAGLSGIKDNIPEDSEGDEQEDYTEERERLAAPSSSGVCKRTGVLVRCFNPVARAPLLEPIPTPVDLDSWLFWTRPGKVVVYSFSLIFTPHEGDS